MQPPPPPPLSKFPTYRGAALTCSGGPWCRGCRGRWNHGRPPTSAPCSPLGRCPPPPPTAGGDRHPQCVPPPPPRVSPKRGSRSPPTLPFTPHLTWGSPNSTRTLPRSCSSPTSWNQSEGGGLAGAVNPPIHSPGRGLSQPDPPPPSSSPHLCQGGHAGCPRRSDRRGGSWGSPRLGRIRPPVGPAAAAPAWRSSCAASSPRTQRSANGGMVR